MALSRYAELFDVVEIQSTFYRLPAISTAEIWRNRVPQDFRFTVKAFQGVTHPISSPTWRRAGGQKPTRNVENYGHLRPTEENFECWRRTIEVCKALEAVVCVVQLPPSFTRSDENTKNLLGFFRSAEMPVPVGVELRHPSWDEDRSATEAMLNEIGVVHVVDPLVKAPAVGCKLSYFRLHGLGERLYK
jgi:uncharacterized protein YecE (DUF72 family)